MTTQPIVYAGLTFAIAMIAGLYPIYSSASNRPDRLKTLTGVAAGIIIASSMLIVLPEGFELATHSASAPEAWVVGAALLAGFLFMLILEGSGIGHAIHEEHHDHHDDHGHDHVHHGTNGWIVMLGLSLHAMTDGLAIGAAAASESVYVTVSVALAVLIHRGPAGFSLGVFSMHEREHRRESVRDVLIFSLATPVMLLLSYNILSDVQTSTIGLAMLFSAGTFLYVATVDTLPDIHNPISGRKAMMHVVLGAFIMLLIIVLGDFTGVLSHEH